MRSRCLVVCSIFAMVTTFGLAASVSAQGNLASVAGRVFDPNGAVIVEATVTARDVDKGIETTVQTNEEGIYRFVDLSPGNYEFSVSKRGFKVIVKPSITLHVADTTSMNFTMQVGAVSEKVLVEGGAPLINTEGAAVSTVIDRNFVENLPLNGRSFNTLLQLTPGVVIAPVSPFGQSGQFSISGQRTDANSFTVDGVSANFGVGNALRPGESGTGGAQAFSALGATSSLVSVDALQEFRIETSSFAPEFGKTPGGQVILSTRSGTTDFHGGIFDYFRNTVMDANDWFNNSTLDPTTGKALPRAPEQHNDFGAFFGGPIGKNKTFFFFSYEGARLRLPQTVVIQVPSMDTRASAPAALAPYLNAYPKPNGPVSPGDSTAQFTGSLSHRATLDATSIRIDHNFNDRFSIFGRYNYAPSQAQAPFGPSSSLSNPNNASVDTQTLTVGLNMALSSKISNTVRGNYSMQHNATSATLDSFGGAVPLTPNLLLGSLPTTETEASFQTFDTVSYTLGTGGKDQARQANFTDALAVTAGSHQLKFGGDYRAIFLDVNAPKHSLQYSAPDVPTFLSTGSMTLVDIAILPSQFLTQAFSLYAQDTWKVKPRITLTYGLRWELNPAPSARGNTTLAAWQNVKDPTNTALAPAGSPLWATTYGNFAPRFGLAYSLTPSGDFVLRAGAGIFYDLGVGESSNLGVLFPNGTFSFSPVVSVPSSDLSPFLATNFSRQPPYPGEGFDPNLVLPRSYQWNIAVEKSLGRKQTISVTYVGQAGRDLLRQKALFQPNSNFLGNDFLLTQNSARSNYNAFELQFRRPLSSRLQTLLSYTWSHSLDNSSNDVVAGLGSNIISGANDYASSDFDVRHSLSGALSYDVPAAAKSGVIGLLTGHWSLHSVIVARTGFPFNGLIRFATADPGRIANSRPDRVLGQPLWISDQSAGGGKSLNPNALIKPPTPRQGTEGRNDIPGFGLTQVDLSIGRRFPVGERINLQFRTDAFNIFNHPNFANPDGLIELGASGLKSPAMLNAGLGGLNSLFQQGGPRSLQLSLKLMF
jgi:hypothetical protein